MSRISVILFASLLPIFPSAAFIAPLDPQDTRGRSLPRFSTVEPTSDRRRGADVISPTSDTASMDPREEWLTKRLSSQEIQEARVELLKKYIRLGKDQDRAEFEVDMFLSDPEQSQQFLEMRRRALLQSEEEFDGQAVALELMSYFAVGFMVTVVPRLVMDWKGAVLEEGLSWIS